MQLDAYYDSQAAKPQSDVDLQLQVKKTELEKVLATARPTVGATPAKIAVLGCGDKRFVALHRAMFAEALGTEVAITTYDISTAHLGDEPGVVQHDTTLPLPDTGFALVYSHVLLKFIVPAQQWSVVKNSHDALAAGGIAVHVLNMEETEADGEQIAGGYFAVPLGKIKGQLEAVGVPYMEVDWSVPGPDGAPIRAMALVLLKR